MGTKITNFDLNKIINEFVRENNMRYPADYSKDEDYPPVIVWFNKKYNGNLEYTSSYSSIYFQDEKDATLFLLKQK